MQGNLRKFDINYELKKLPDSPGVYIMYDKEDKIIYVGKSVSLKNRVCLLYTSGPDLAVSKAPVQDAFQKIIGNAGKFLVEMCIRDRDFIVDYQKTMETQLRVWVYGHKKLC